MSASFLFLLGLSLLIVGAEMVVRGASRLALSMGIRPIVLGLTIVAVGTSMPELAVGVIASTQGSGALAVGNIAGTNVFNLIFILGLSALIQPLPLHARILKLELPVILAAATLMTALAWDGLLSRMDGGIMLLTAIAYTALLIQISRGEVREVKREFQEAFDARLDKPNRAKETIILAAGLALSVLGADWLVDGAVGLARAWGFSDALIGLTIVAVGTSSPEMATTIVATIKGERDVAIGNLIGSSIYNILVILGATCLVPTGGIPVERQLLSFDIPIMVVVCYGAMPVFLTGRQVSRFEGAAGIALYIVYMIWLLAYRA